VHTRISAVLKRTASLKEDFMHISNESLVLVLVVGVVAGWLAGQLVRGTGFGLIGDLIIGVIGAFIGTWLLPQLNIHIGSGMVGAIVAATIGAVLLLIILRVIRGRGRW
jgi:uncharacterized membrane protein YeaQ/YmgE (transglycosylase-associated protein family)